MGGTQGQFDGEKLEGFNDINITPFVDVVLVLLVIFIVTAPMMMKDIIGLKLPKTTSSDSQSYSTLAIAITKNGQFFMNGELALEDQIKAKCMEYLSKNKDVQAVISADVEARHGDVVRAIDLIKSSGISQFAIQIEKQSNDEMTTEK